MNGIGFLAVSFLVLVGGCSSPGVDPTGAAKGGYSPPQPTELKYRSDPPVRSRLKVSDAEIRGWAEVSYIPYDLNGDGKPEYFIVDQHHAHACTFVLVDGGGEGMLEPRVEDSEFMSESGEWATDWGFFCCDQLLILESSHEGYFDLLTIDTDWNRTPTQTWALWVRKNSRYAAQEFRNELCFYTHSTKGPAPFIGVVGTYEGPHEFASPRLRAYWSALASSRW